jgi:hypothetical protein
VSPFRNLSLAFVEVQQSIDLGLTHKQFLKALFMLKESVRLGLVIGERLLQVIGALLLLRGDSFQGRNVCSMLCTVPSVFSGLRCAG